VLLPALLHRLLVTLRHQRDVIGSRTAPSGGRIWKVGGDGEAPGAEGGRGLGSEQRDLTGVVLGLDAAQVCA
jgi:hypothetical protein